MPPHRRTILRSLVLAGALPAAEIRAALAATEASEFARDSAAALARLYGIDRLACAVGPRAV